VAGLEMEEFSLVVYGADLVWVNVLVFLLILGDGVVSPRSFPEPEVWSAFEGSALALEGISSYLYSTRKYSSA
jgi:hypothetical protein